MSLFGIDMLWIAGTLFVLAILYFLVRRHQHQQETTSEMPPRPQVIDDSNYNIDNTGLGDDTYENLSPAEARRIRDQWEAEGYIPSDEEFYRVKEALGPDAAGEAPQK